MKKFSTFLIVVLCVGSFLFLFHQPAKAIGQTAVVQITGPNLPPGFSPGLLTIHQYDTITFINTTSTSYSVGATNNGFSSSAIRPGGQWSVTFGSTGEFEYHATTAPQKMVGEVLVVSNAVTLLPTPVPQVEATVVTMIKAGKHPPDTIVLNPPAPVSKQKAPVTSFSSTIFSPRVLSITGGLLFVLLIAVLAIILLRRRARKQREAEEMEALLDDIVPSSVALKPAVAPTQVLEATPTKQKRPLLAGLRWKRTKHDDDDEDEDFEDEV